MTEQSQDKILQTKIQEKRRKKPIEKDWVEFLVAGGSAGAIARTCVAPIERVKIIFQVNKGGQYKSLGPQLVREEGILSLWKGNSAAVIRVIPYMSLTFLGYEKYNGLYSNVNSLTLRHLMAGSSAGVTAVLITYPLDLVRARLAMQERNALKHQYKGVFDALVTIPKRHGFAALYRGISPTLVGVAPYNGLKFAAYDAIKYYSRKFTGKTEETLPVQFRLFAGGLAGLIAQTFTYPMDVLRRRMQTFDGVGSRYSSVTAGLREIVAEEGIRRGLYRGLTLNYLKTIPNVMIYMSLYDIFKQQLFKLRDGARL